MIIKKLVELQLDPFVFASVIYYFLFKALKITSPLMRLSFVRFCVFFDLFMKSRD